MQIKKIMDFIKSIMQTIIFLSDPIGFVIDFPPFSFQTKSFKFA